MGQNCLHVPGERWHIMEVERDQVLGRKDSLDAWQSQRFRLIDALNPRMSVRAPHEIAEDRPRHDDIVHVIALALHEADVLDALTFAANPFKLFLALAGCLSAHSAASFIGVALILSAAYRIAFTM